MTDVGATHASPLPAGVSIWHELAALVGDEKGERAILRHLFAHWCAASAAPEAALYVETGSGLRLESSSGGQDWPVAMKDFPGVGAVRDSPLQRHKFPGGLLVFRPPADNALALPEPATLLLGLGSRLGVLKRQLKDHRFQSDYRGVQLDALYDVGLAIASTLDLEQLSEIILLRAVALLDARRGALYLIEDGGYRLKRAVAGDALEVAPADVAGVLEPRDLLPGAAFALAVPIAVEGQALGLLVLADKERRGGVGPFPPTDRRTLGMFANQAAIALENARLHLEALEKERLERELELAADIQRRILPASVPLIPGYELFGWTRPARQVGGDHYDFLPLAGGRLCMSLGDVSGKGMPAALLVSTLHSAVQLLLDRIEVSPQLLVRLNRHILDSSAPNKFITLFLVDLDPQSGVLRFVNAGHNPGVLVRPDGTSKYLESGGVPLGIMPDPTYRMATLEMGPGDLLCLYSDGITESFSPEDEEFGLARLVELLVARRSSPLPEIIDAIDEATTAFSRGRPQGDDQTVVLLRRCPIVG